MIRKIFLLSIVFLITTNLITKSAYKGVVIEVVDGDTIKVKDDKNRIHMVRLANINAPELRQYYGEKSKDELAKLCLNSNVRIEVEDTNNKQIQFARVFCNTRNGRVYANLAQVEKGAAFYVFRFISDIDFSFAEGHAKRFKLGIWRYKSPQYPPYYRSKFK